MPLTFRRRDFIFLIFPKLRFTKFSFDSVKWLYDFNKKRRNKQNNSKAKMKWSMIIAAGSGVAFLIAILFGFVWFPRTIKAKIKKMVNLDPHSDIRKMFVKVPFGLDFKVYMFNVTNSLDVHAGKTPIVSEIGPFCYKEWKEKVEVSDDDENDVMFYKSKDTFYKSREPGCLSGEELITLPHPMILGMVNILIRTKPAMLTLAAKAINSIYRNPPTIFLTAKANDLLFDGVIIDCNVSDFAGKAVCSQLKAEGSGLMPISDTELGFSFIGPVIFILKRCSLNALRDFFPQKNGTGKKFKVYRGVKESRNVGLVLEYDEKKEMDVWPTKECNQFKGTDGTIFPPMLEAEEGLAAFAPDLCRSLISVYEQDTKYDGIPVRLYTATLGDMSKNADEKCYCPTPETCLKKGIMDLFKCADAAIYASLPHFYEADESYVNGVIGLKPNREQHGIEILFEPLTGSPVQAKKRLMFSMPLETNAKVKQFNNLSTVILPMFWIEEGVALNATFIKPLKDLARIIKIVEVFSWLLTVGSVGGLAAAVYLHLHQSGKLNITRKEVKPEKNNRGMSGVSQDGFGGHVNHAMSDNEIEKY